MILALLNFANTKEMVVCIQNPVKHVQDERLCRSSFWNNYNNFFSSKEDSFIVFSSGCKKFFHSSKLVFFEQILRKIGILDWNTIKKFLGAMENESNEVYVLKIGNVGI